MASVQKTLFQELFIRVSVQDKTGVGFAKIVNATNKLNKAADKTGTKFLAMSAKVGKSLTNIGNKMRRVGMTLFRSITLPITAIGLAALKVGTEFEKSMNRVRATTQATGEDFEALEAKAKSLGATTPRSARDIAKGMATLGLAGFETVQILEAIPEVTNLSIISFQNMEKSAQDAADLMSQFSLGADGLGKAIDTLAATATSTNTTVDQLIQGFKFAGPIASQLGISLDETAAAMGTMANSGIRAGIAGRSLRMGLLNLSAPSSRASKQMNALGFSSFDASGNFKGMEEILGDLNESMKDYGDETRNAALRNIFGARALGPFAKMLEQQATSTTITTKQYEAMGEGLAALGLKVGDSINQFQLLQVELESSAGRAQEVADIFQEGLPGSLERFKSASESALIRIKEAFEDPLQDLLDNTINPFLIAFATMDSEMELEGTVVGKERVDDMIFSLQSFRDRMQDVVDKLGIFQKFLSEDLSTPEFITRLGAIVAIIPIIVLTLSGFLNILGFVFTAFGKLGFVWTALKWIATSLLIPVLNGLWVVIQVVAGFVFGLSFAAAALILVIIAAVAAIIIWRDEIGEFFKMIGKWIGETWQKFVKWLKDIPDQLKLLWEKIKEFWEDVKTFFSELPAKIGEFFDKVIEIFAVAIQFLKDNWKEMFTLMIAAIVLFIVFVITKLIEFFSWLITGFINAGKASVKAVVDFWTAIVKFIGDAIQAIIDTVIFLFIEMPKWVFETMQKLKKAFSEGLDTVVAWVGNAVIDIIAWVKELPGKLAAVALNVSIVFLQALKDGFAAVMTWFSELPGKLFDFAMKSLKFLSDLGTAFIDGIKLGLTGGLTGLLTRIRTLAEDLIQKFKDVLGINSPSTIFKGFGANIISGLIDGLTNGATALFSKVKEIGTGILSKFKEFFGDVPETAQDATDKIQEALDDARNKAGNFILGIDEDLMEGYQDFTDDGVRTIVEEIVEGSGTVEEAVVDESNNRVITPPVEDDRRLNFEGQQTGALTGEVIGDSKPNVIITNHNEFHTGTTTEEIEEMLRRQEREAALRWEVA